MKTYQEQIHENIGLVHQTNVANKILQFMSKIRNESDISQARRFVIELMQNARDLAYETEDGKKMPVYIQIRLTDSELTFSHNAKVFSVKDILSIIHQVSSKKPGEGIGQFGTGFMSTYQLSEVIELNSYLKDMDNPYKPFKIKLDRSGHDKETILQAIECSLQELLQVDKNPGIEEENFDKAAYNTVFTYHLNHKRSKEIARTGMNDLGNMILYILLFSSQIKKVELIYDTEDQKENIVYTSCGVSDLKDNLKKIQFFCKEKEYQLVFETIEFMGETITVACEYAEKSLLPFNNKTSKIYVDFPLIGAERFPFPVAVNSRLFQPNEPRSGISLVDNEISSDAKKNKLVMEKAVELYGRFLHDLVKNGFKGIENVIYMPKYEKNKEWSEQWVEEHLYRECLKLISQENIFLTRAGMKSLSEPALRIIEADSEEEKLSVQNLANIVQKILVPMDQVDWNTVLSGYMIDEQKKINLRYLLEKAVPLVYDINLEKMNRLEFLGKIYYAAMKNEALSVEIMSGRIAIFLDQEFDENSSIQLRYFYELKMDPNIPEWIKDVSECLDELCGLPACKLKIRSELMNKNFPILEDKKPENYEIYRLINYICRETENTDKKNDRLLWGRYKLLWRKIWWILIACGPDENIKRIADQFWNTDISEGIDIVKDERFGNEMWKHAYRKVIQQMISQIETWKNLEGLSNGLEVEEKKAIEWLNDFYQTAGKYIWTRELKEKRIMLTQAGDFTLANFTMIDHVDEELKKIALVFGDREDECKLEIKLVDKRVTLPNWDMVVMETSNLTDRINRVILKILSEKSLSMIDIKYQEACTSLLGWIGEHEEEAEQYFPMFCKEEDQMKLLTPKAAVSMKKKARQLEKIMQKIGAKNENDLDVILSKLSEASLNLSDAREMEDDKSLAKKLGVDFEGDDNFLQFYKDRREERLRAIGKSGEKYVYFWLIENLKKSGCFVISQTDNVCSLKDAKGDFINVYKPDNEGYHQVGWDIKVEKSHKNSDHQWQVDSTDYYEVKTSTKESRYRKLLRISNEQMVKAAEMREHYHVVKTICDVYSLEIIEMKMYDNLLEQLVSGKLKNLQDGYMLVEKN